jgi:histidinol phosphatase-like PHP family hydrolase
MPLANFHAHSTLSDGALSPMELLHTAVAAGYRAIAVTDHAGIAEFDWLAGILVPSCRLAEEQWGIRAISGVELTHLPPASIPEAARRAKEAGLELVVVHGETPVERVPPGTNRAAVSSPHVDILGHPGLLTAVEAQMAAERGIFLELTSRRGHSLANGLVAQRATAAGASLLLDSDAHDPGDLWNESFARTVLLGAGVPETALEEILVTNPQSLLQRLRQQIQSSD